MGFEMIEMDYRKENDVAIKAMDNKERTDQFIEKEMR